MGSSHQAGIQQSKQLGESRSKQWLLFLEWLLDVETLFIFHCNNPQVAWQSELLKDPDCSHQLALFCSAVVKNLAYPFCHLLDPARGDTLRKH